MKSVMEFNVCNHFKCNKLYHLLSLIIQWKREEPEINLEETEEAP